MQNSIFLKILFCSIFIVSSHLHALSPFQQVWRQTGAFIYELLKQLRAQEPEKKKSLDEFPSFDELQNGIQRRSPFWDGMSYPQPLAGFSLSLIIDTLRESSYFFYKKNLWLNGIMPKKEQLPYLFSCSIERLVLQPKSTCFFIGSINGDVRSLGYLLDYFVEQEILDPSTYKIINSGVF